MSLLLPRNALSILQARKVGLKPEFPVIVSFVGQTKFDNPHVFADSGKLYDWRFLHHLCAQIFVKPGIDWGHAGVSIFDEADPIQSYPWLVDVETEKAACIVDVRPLKLWPLSPGTDAWKEFFA